MHINMTEEMHINMTEAARLYVPRTKWGHASAASGIDKQVKAAIKEIHDALIHRPFPMQMAAPIGGESLLAVLDCPISYLPLIHALIRPGHGYYPGDLKDSIPFKLPKSWQPRRPGPAVEINKAIRRVYDWKASKSKQDPTFKAWCDVNQPTLLKLFETMPAEQEMAMWVQPKVPHGSIICWYGYHTTFGSETDTVKGALFFNFFRRNEDLTREQERTMGELYRGAHIDFGAGQGRGSYYTWEYQEARGLRQGLDDEMFKCWSKSYAAHPPLFGNDHPAVQTLAKRGWGVFCIQDDHWQQLFDAATAECADFAHFHIFEKEGVQPVSCRKLDWTNHEEWSLLLGGRKGVGEAYSDDFFMYQRRANGKRSRNGQNGGIKIPADSGLGPATSFFGGTAHTKLMLHPLTLLFSRIFYDDPGVAFERFRAKVKSHWAAAHVDHHPFVDPTGTFVERLSQFAKRPTNGGGRGAKRIKAIVKQ